MSRWTLQVNEILNNYAFGKDLFNLPFDTLIQQTMNDFFNFDFEWYTDEVDTVTGEKIGLQEFKRRFLEKYMMWEIGYETIELFRLYLAGHLRINMPRWKELYKVISRDFDVLTDRKIERLDKRVGKNEKTGRYSDTGNSTTNSQGILSDNPQVTIATQDYASNMSRNESVGETVNEGDNNLSEEYNHDMDSKETGYFRTPASMIMEWEKAIINLNKEIVDSCEECFLGIW